jgi:hypothetical protein
MIQINELVLRIPAANYEEGDLLGKEVAQRVADALPEGRENFQIPELKIQMTASQVNNASGMAEAIAEQIVREIKLAML